MWIVDALLGTSLTFHSLPPSLPPSLRNRCAFLAAGNEDQNGPPSSYSSNNLRRRRTQAVRTLGGRREGGR